MLDTTDIGFEISDEDFEFLRRATVGNEQRILKTLVKYSIMKMHRIGKKRKIGRKFVIYKRGDETPKMYDKLNAKVGEKTRIAINLLAMLEFHNGNGDVNEFCNKIDKDYESWVEENGKKIEKEVEKK